MINIPSCATIDDSPFRARQHPLPPVDILGGMTGSGRGAHCRRRSATLRRCSWKRFHVKEKSS